MFESLDNPSFIPSTSLFQLLRLSVLTAYGIRHNSPFFKNHRSRYLIRLLLELGFLTKNIFMLHVIEMVLKKKYWLLKIMFFIWKKKVKKTWPATRQNTPGWGIWYWFSIKIGATLSWVKSNGVSTVTMAMSWWYPWSSYVSCLFFHKIF